MKDWKEGGHKVICKDLPKAIATAEPLIASTPRSSLNIQESIFGRSIPQENAAQNLCYDAMDCPAGSVEKVRLIIKALKLFPLCIEAWGLLGAYYRHDLPKEQRDYKKSVQLYENAIILSPETEVRGITEKQSKAAEAEFHSERRLWRCATTKSPHAENRTNSSRDG